MLNKEIEKIRLWVRWYEKLEISAANLYNATVDRGLDLRKAKMDYLKVMSEKPKE